MKPYGHGVAVVGRFALALAAALAAIAVGGCNSTPAGAKRSLGYVGYDRAFTTARKVMSQYFSLAHSNRTDGMICSRPRFVESGRNGLGGSRPARQVATLVIRRSGRLITAYLAVAVQQQSSDVFRMMGRREENYSGVANETPADLEAATTMRQRQLWRTVRYDHELQRKILDQLAQALGPPPQGEKGRRRKGGGGGKKSHD